MKQACWQSIANKEAMHLSLFSVKNYLIIKWLDRSGTNLLCSSKLEEIECFNTLILNIYNKKE